MNVRAAGVQVRPSRQDFHLRFLGAGSGRSPRSVATMGAAQDRTQEGVPWQQVQRGEHLGHQDVLHPAATMPVLARIPFPGQLLEQAANRTVVSELTHG